MFYALKILKFIFVLDSSSTKMLGMTADQVPVSVLICRCCSQYFCTSIKLGWHSGIVVWGGGGGWVKGCGLVGRWVGGYCLCVALAGFTIPFPVGLS